MTQMVNARSRFMVEFRNQLAQLHDKNPQLYKWPITELPTVVGRMSLALNNAAYEITAPAVKATCKVLGIKNTYVAVQVFINGDKLYELKGE